MDVGHDIRHGTKLIIVYAMYDILFSTVLIAALIQTAFEEVGQIQLISTMVLGAMIGCIWATMLLYRAIGGLRKGEYSKPPHYTSLYNLYFRPFRPFMYTLPRALWVPIPVLLAITWLLFFWALLVGSYWGFAIAFGLTALCLVAILIFKAHSAIRGGGPTRLETSVSSRAFPRFLAL